MEKLELCGYPMVKNFEDMITPFDTIHKHECDRWMERQTDGQTPYDGIGCAYCIFRTISRGFSCHRGGLTYTTVRPMCRQIHRHAS